LTPTSACQFEFVDTSDRLSTLLASFGGVDRIAIDTEADSLHHYFEKVCLIQLTFRDRTYIVDPLAGIKLDSLLKALADKALVFHGAEYDLRMLRADYRFRPKGEVFDTMLAAQLVEGKSCIQQGAQEHIAADAAEDIEVEGGHEGGVARALI